MHFLMKLMLIFFILLSFFSFGQNMEKHLWKNRVLLIYSIDEKSQKLENQLTILREHKKKLLERKIVVYSFTEKRYSFNFKNKWENSEILYSKFNPKNELFRVILIGLDGKIKLEQPTILSTEKLFTIIDRMPIRKREIRNKN
jgi:hypothetical protein